MSNAWKQYYNWSFMLIRSLSLIWIIIHHHKIPDLVGSFTFQPFAEAHKIFSDVDGQFSMVPSVEQINVLKFFHPWNYYIVCWSLSLLFFLLLETLGVGFIPKTVGRKTSKNGLIISKLVAFCNKSKYFGLNGIKNGDDGITCTSRNFFEISWVINIYS